jgi:type IV pilus assembly protein PilW
VNSPVARNRLKRRDSGFTLIELMISMLLGLIIVGAVVGVMLANRRSYGTNQGLAQVQESARTTYELLAKDVREAAGNGCGSTARTANVLTPGALWWQGWFGVRAFDSTQVDPAVAIGTAVGTRVAGTDSIQVQSIDGTGLSVAVHDPVAGQLNINAAATDFVPGDIMMVCDFDHATVFQASASGAGPGVVSVSHNVGVGAPGNCSSGLGFPTDCGSVTGNIYTFPRNAQIGRLLVTSWYIGNNGRADEGGRSLYRQRLGAGGGVVTEEIVAGVTDMQLQFRADGANNIIADASLVPDWTTISSVLVRLTARSSDVNVSTDSTVNSGRIERTFNYLITLRNRLP